MTQPKEDKFYQDILSSLQDGVVVVSMDGNIVEINTSAEKICGLSASKACTMMAVDLLSDNMHLLNLVNKAISSGSSYVDVEYNFFQRTLLTHIPLRVLISPLHHSSGHMSGVIVILRDLSHLKELEDHIHSQERLSTLGSLAASMAHEIKNPLGGIKGAAQLLKNELLDKGFDDYLTVIIKETDRINAIISDLLTSSTPGKIVYESVNIHKILEDVLLLQKESVAGKNIIISQKYDPSIPSVSVDTDQMTQVFLNVIKNAFESMSERGGELCITTRVSLDYHLFFRGTTKPCQVVVVSIVDSGSGIPEEQLNHIFTPFVTTKPEGSGLGLAISNRIVEAHQGRIKICNNTDSSGTTVQVFLPLRRQL